MAKRNTVGGPKKKVISQEDLERRSSYRSKAEIEHERDRYMRIGAAIVGVIALIAVVVALVYDTLAVPRQALTSVGEDEVSVSTFQNRVQYERFALAEQVRAFYNNARAAGLNDEEAENQVLSIFAQSGGSIELLLNDDLFGEQVLKTIEEELIIAQAAKEYGVEAEVDEAAVQEQIDRLSSLLTGEGLEVTPSPTPSLTPTITLTPLVSPTVTPTPEDTATATPTPSPTTAGCAAGDAACPTPTTAPSSTPSETPTATPETTETPTRTPISPDESKATVEAFRADYLDGGQDESGLSEEDVRQVFYYEALRQALTEYITTQTDGDLAEYYVSPEDIWVDTRHILVSFPDGEPVPEGDDNEYFREAQRIVDSLNAGEPFAAVAIATSGDLGSGANGGSLGWSSSSGYVEGFKEAVETLPIGEISAPVRSQFGYHIIQVMDREVRPYDEQRLDQLQAQKFNEWVAIRQTEVTIERREGWQDFIPEQPDYNALLSDILPRYNPASGFEQGEDE